MVRRLMVSAARLFGQQVTKVAASATIAAADGPFPIGDAIALVGIAWTGYDVSCAQAEFKRELSEALNAAVEDVKSVTLRDVHTGAKRLIEEQMNQQKLIGEKALIMISAEGR